MDGVRDILLGVDFGTGGCKVSALSAADGRLLGDASVEYATEYAHAGWSEQNPDDWYAAMRGAIRAVAAKGVDLSKVRALAFDGSTHNAVLMDAGYKPIRKTIRYKIYKQPCISDKRR